MLLTALVSFATAGWAGWLWWRIQSAAREADASLAGQPSLEGMRRLVAAGLDAHLAAAADVPLVFREHADPYTTVAEASVFLRGCAGGDRLAALDDAVKAAYQIAHALGVPAAEASSAVTPLAERIRELGRPTRGETRTVFVDPGSLIDPRQMLSLGYGSRVGYPLGVAVTDPSGKILAKAKVLSD